MPSTDAVYKHQNIKDTLQEGEDMKKIYTISRNFCRTTELLSLMTSIIIQKCRLQMPESRAVVQRLFPDSYHRLGDKQEWLWNRNLF